MPFHNSPNRLRNGLLGAALVGCAILSYQTHRLHDELKMLSNMASTANDRIDTIGRALDGLPKPCADEDVAFSIRSALTHDMAARNDTSLFLRVYDGPTSFPEEMRKAFYKTFGLPYVGTQPLSILTHDQCRPLALSLRDDEVGTRYARMLQGLIEKKEGK